MSSGAADGDIAQLIDDARRAESERDWRRAHALWTTVVGRDDNHVWAHVQSALLLGELGDPGGCEARLLAVRRRWPRETAPVIGLARHATRIGDHGRAERHWTETLVLDPTNLWAPLELAEAYARRGDRATADALIADAIRHHEDRQEPWVRLARVATADHEWARAEAAWSEVIERNPTLPAALEGLAQAVQRQGRTEEAIALLRCLAQTTQLTTSQSIALARLLASSGRDEEVGAVLTPLLDRGAFTDSGDEYDPQQRQASWGLIASGLGDLARAKLFDPPAPGTSTEDTPTAAATIVDPCLSTVSGHHFNLTRFWRSWLESLGLGPLEVLTHRRFDDPVLSAELGSVPYFSLAPAIPIEWFSTSSALERLNTAYAHELSARPSLRNRRLVIDHSCRLNTIGGFVAWLRATDSSTPRTAVAGLVATEFLSPDHPHHRIGQRLWSRIADEVAGLDGTHLVVTAETTGFVEFLRGRLPSSVTVMLMPYLAAPEQPWRDRSPSSPITIGYLGGTRVRRGPDLIGRVVESLVETSTSDIRFVLQVDLELVRHMCGRTVGAELAVVAAHPCVDLVPTGLPADEFHDLFDTIDIMVLPYRDRYEQSGSGIFVEGLASGKVQVLPASSAMAEFAKGYDAGAVFFDEASPEPIADALRVAVDEFDDRRERATEAARRWRVDQSARRSALAAAFGHG